MARANRFAAPVFRRLAPLKLALEMVLPIWSRSAAKSFDSAVRLAVSSEASEAASALVRSWFRRSETVSPAETATSTVEEARLIESFTAS